jgi:MYXO-CTERM domain-containing protein
MRASIRPVVFTLVAIGATFAADAARADVLTGPCDIKMLDCSNGGASLHVESRDPVVSSIGTGWLPACATPDAQGHCGTDEPIQVSASIDLGAFPTPSTEPLWMVDMARSTVVDARWPSTAAFDLTLPKSTIQDGTFKVSHTLIPEVRVYADLLGYTKTWTYDASTYLTQFASNFAYAATNTVKFDPWGMDQAVTNVVPSPALTTTTLLNFKIVNTTDNDVDVALAAKTSPTFTYRTTKVTLAGASAITPGASVGKLPMVDADYLDLKADVEGEITVEGELVAAPYVKINKIGGLTVPSVLGTLDLSSALNAPKKAYTAAPPVAVKFPAVTVHIPLPNVKVPSGLDFGSVQVGQRSEKSATVKNTGELGAKMTFESSDPQFTVTGAALSDAKTDYALAVQFTPANEGPASATITVKSNDPDSPVQTFQVTANGTAVPVEAPAPPAEDPAMGPADNSGCGCHAAPVGSSYGALAGLGLAALLVSRRRRAR